MQLRAGNEPVVGGGDTVRDLNMCRRACGRLIQWDVDRETIHTRGRSTAKHHRRSGGQPASRRRTGHWSTGHLSRRPTAPCRSVHRRRRRTPAQNTPGGGRSFPAGLAHPRRRWWARVQNTPCWGQFPPDLVHPRGRGRARVHLRVGLQRQASRTAGQRPHVPRWHRRLRGGSAQPAEPLLGLEQPTDVRRTSQRQRRRLRSTQSAAALLNSQRAVMTTLFIM